MNDSRLMLHRSSFSARCEREAWQAGISFLQARRKLIARAQAESLIERSRRHI